MVKKKRNNENHTMEERKEEGRNKGRKREKKERKNTEPKPKKRKRKILLKSCEPKEESKRDGTSVKTQREEARVAYKHVKISRLPRWCSW